MKNFIKRLFGMDRVDVHINIQVSNTDIELEQITTCIKWAEKMQKEHSCNCTLSVTYKGLF